MVSVNACWLGWRVHSVVARSGWRFLMAYPHLLMSHLEWVKVVIPVLCSLPFSSMTYQNSSVIPPFKCMLMTSSYVGWYIILKTVCNFSEIQINFPNGWLLTVCRLLFTNVLSFHFPEGTSELSVSHWFSAPQTCWSHQRPWSLIRHQALVFFSRF